MKLQLALCLGLTLCGSSRLGWAQRPANDDFADRIILEGNEIVFPGTLVGATRESYGYGEIGAAGCALGPTVWWSWTASQTAPVFLESINPSQAAGPNSYACMTVWPEYVGTGFPVITNLETFVHFDPITSMFLSENVPRSYCIFSATNGNTYHFQLAVGSAQPRPTNLFRFHLVSSMAPLITEQPMNLTVCSNGSALFKVAAAGALPLLYQWKRNDVDIPGATAAFLMLTNVTPEQTGLYTVAVSNFGGVTVSDAANLWLGMADQRPILSAALLTGIDSFGFDLCGGPGRPYRIESSLNLTNWEPQNSFDTGSIYGSTFSDFPPTPGPILSSVVFNTNATSVLSVLNIPPRKYFRASPYTPSNELCNINLKLIRFGKDLWVRKRHQGVNDWVTPGDLRATNELFQFFYQPRCPEGGFYMYGVVGVLPTCSIPGHVLEEPR